jgi:hypothetical protein
LIVCPDLKLERFLNFVSVWLFIALVDGRVTIGHFSFPLFVVRQRKLDGDLKWGLRALVNAMLFFDVRFGR